MFATYQVPACDDGSGAVIARAARKDDQQVVQIVMKMLLAVVDVR
jgi:hypothetical protein